MATLRISCGTKTGLPYDYSLSHHQLLFNTLVIVRQIWK